MASGNASIAVAIVNFNTCAQLRACLKTVCAEDPAEIVVVDNNSSDDSVEMVREEYPDVVIKVNRSNAGYGAAANLAISCTRSEYILLLNSDTLLQDGSLECLRAFLDDNPDSGIVGPRLVNPDGSWQPSCFYFPGSLRWFVVNNPLGFVIRHVPVLRRRSLHHTRPNRTRLVPWVMGAAMAIRRDVFDRLDGFDESYFIYYEEVDLCLRMASTRWRVHFTPHATVVHVGGASTSQNCAESLAQKYVSAFRFYRKHCSRPRYSFWRLTLKTKLLLMLIRSRIRLQVADAERNPQLKEDAHAWKLAYLTK